MNDRLQRFRQYMAHLDAAANPARALERGHYVPRPGSVVDRLVPRVELRPHSASLLVGGVGSGKTTELLVAVQTLARTPDVVPLFVDVSVHHDVDQLRPGVLATLVGLALSDMVPPERCDVAVEHRTAELMDDAYGGHRASKTYNRWSNQQAWESEPPLPPSLQSLPEEARLVPPASLGLPEDVLRIAPAVATLRERAVGAERHVVVFADALDRVTDLGAFAALVDADVALLRALGLGVVLVGPPSVLYSTNRTLAERFDGLYQQPVLDVARDSEARAFLHRVLRARAPVDILGNAAIDRLVGLCGGILRDLVHLARSAGEEAYLDGSDTVEDRHVDAAADAFGRKLILGVGQDGYDALMRLHRHGTFVPTSDRDLALLATNRVLEYNDGRPRYAVHPTLAPLLEQLAA